MRTSFHRIRTTDNLELPGLLYEPDVSTEIVLVHVHGMAGNFYENKFLETVAAELTNNGIAFAAFNNRGCEFFKDFFRSQGSESKTVRIGDAYERFEECLIDINSYIDFLDNRGFKSIHLSGHSLGAPKAAYYVVESGDKRLKSLLLLSPADMLGLAREDQNRFQEDIALAQKMITESRETEIMPRLMWDEYPLSAATYINLFAENSKTGIFNFFDQNETYPSLSKIPIPVFAVMGKKDNAVTVPVEEVMEKIKSHATSSSRCETVILGDADHGYRGYEQKLAATIRQWLERL